MTREEEIMYEIYGDGFNDHSAKEIEDMLVEDMSEEEYDEYLIERERYKFRREFDEYEDKFYND